MEQNLDREIVRTTEGDTVLSVKLRGQDQLGIAARNISVVSIFNSFTQDDDHKLTIHDRKGDYAGYSIELRK